MSTVNGTGSSSNIYDQINQTNQKNSTSSSNSASAAQDSQMFMKLMIAQLQNQDPTSPANTTDFMQQIANMSSVESINNLTAAVGDMKSSMLSSQAALKASSMVGQTVFTEGDTQTLYKDGDYARGALALDASAPNVTIEVHDASGKLVSTAEMGNLAPGTHDFAWGGDGYTAGDYTLVAKSTAADGTVTKLPLYIGQTVNSVSLGQNGIGMTVNTDTGSYSMDKIKQIG